MGSPDRRRSRPPINRAGQALFSAFIGSTTPSSAPQAYADTVRRLGGPSLSIADVVAVWHLGPTATVLEHFLARPVTTEDMACFSQCFRVAVAEVRSFPGIVAMLDDLAGDGRGLGVFTTATQWAAELMLTSSGLGDRFACIIGGDRVEQPKPSAEGLDLACRHLGVPPDRTAYVVVAFVAGG